MATVSSDAFVNVRLYHGANALMTCVSEPVSGEKMRKLSPLLRGSDVRSRAAV